MVIQRTAVSPSWGSMLRAAQQQAPPQVEASDAEWLLCHALGIGRAALYARLRDALEPAGLARFTALWQRRCDGEPYAYLVGEREFYGRSFSVAPAVLIPRADTECLLDTALRGWGADRAGLVIDAGSGSGALAISFALERPAASVMAVDFSAAALKVAQANARRLHAACAFWRGNWLTAVQVASVDLILANPPYIADDDPHLAELDRGGEPRAALVAGENGLADLRTLIAQAATVLRPGGRLLLEHGWQQAPDVRRALLAAGYVDVASERDLGGHERVSGGYRPLGPS